MRRDKSADAITTEPQQGFWKKWTPLFVLGLAVVIIVLDTTLLNVSLGTIVRELHTNIASLQWVITAYSLTLAALTITGGRFGDLFGRKKMFMIGAIIFALGSTIASMSPNVGWLIIGESIVEGIGAALMMPATASLLVSTYKGRDRALALGVWGGMAAAGSAIGPILGGYLTSHYSWRWGFRINIFVAILLLLGSVVIKEARDTEEKPTIDVLGIFLSAAGLLAGVFAIIESAELGWWSAKKPLEIAGTTLDAGRLSLVPFSILLAAGLLGFFVWWELRLAARGKTPLLSMKLFANRQFTSGALTTAIISLGQVGLIFGLPVFLQGVHKMDALHTGYAMLPLSIGLLIMAPLGGLLSAKFRPKHIVMVGLLANIVGLGILRSVMGVDSTSSDLILPLLIYGSGIGLCMSQLSNVTLSAVSVQEAGEASGVNNTLRQVGSSLGTAIIGSVVVASIATSLSTGIKNSSVISDSTKQTIATQVAAQSSALEFGGQLKTSVPLTPEETAEIKSISNDGTVKANKTALLFTMIITCVAFAMATQLPNSRNVEKSQSLASGH